MISFIISVDASYSMINNFFERLLPNPIVQKSELVLFLDGINNIATIEYCKEISKSHNNCILIESPKVGYGKANNLAVKASHGEYLFFINTDVFAESDCFSKMLDVLSSGQADCVQPLLLYPQTNLVQCAGTFFGDYYKDHLFDGNIPTSPIVQKTSYRQALTSALYAMKKESFQEFGGFNEFYYNKLEAFELSYKMHLSGKKNLYLSSAIAWHSRGGGRKQYDFDFRQQEAFFWSRYGMNVKEDLSYYINLQLDYINLDLPYYTIDISQLRTWKKTLDKTALCIQEYYDMPWNYSKSINLWDILPNEVHKYGGNILFIMETIRHLNNNKQWFQIRNNPNDLAIDRYGNAVTIMDYIKLPDPRI